ncbi:MAG: hypothetical protein NTZ52_06945 [Chlamydiae bacterium]|nr:hypothetical protein [Chlamydiota bacterium]
MIKIVTVTRFTLEYASEELKADRGVVGVAQNRQALFTCLLLELSGLLHIQTMRPCYPNLFNR